MFKKVFAILLCCRCGDNLATAQAGSTITDRRLLAE